MGVINAVQELRFLPDRQIDVIRIVLAPGETFKPVRNYSFLQGETVSQTGVEGDGVSG
jgi:hypothetical protein